MPNFKVKFQKSSGTIFTHLIEDCPSLEDATIEGTNIAEENDYEMLQIDEV